MALFLIYIVLSFTLILIGLFQVFSSNSETKKTGIKMLVAGLVMFIIGFGSCAYLFRSYL